MQRKILITGGAGFIGGSLADALTNDPNNNVVILDNLQTGSESKLPSREKNNWQYIKCDVNNLNDLQPIMVSNAFDYVFHYAALVGVRRTLENPVKVLNDIEGIKNILHLSKNTGVKRFFYASSSEVYGESISYPQNEISTPLNSRLPYAVVKSVGEAFCRSYKQEYGLNYSIFRFFNTYGPKQSVDFVMSRFLKMALKNEDITVYGDGQQSRTFCYIDDNIESSINAFVNDEYINDVLNIGSEHETSILKLANTIIDITGSNSKIVYRPARLDGDMRRRKPDVKRMNKILNRPKITLEQGIKKLIESKQFSHQLLNA